MKKVFVRSNYLPINAVHELGSIKSFKWISVFYLFRDICAGIGYLWLMLFIWSFYQN